MCRKRTKGLEWIWKEWLQKQKKKTKLYHFLAY
jgi:hypothetical protein